MSHRAQVPWPSSSVLCICRLFGLGSLWDTATPVIQGQGWAGCSSGFPACRYQLHIGQCSAAAPSMSNKLSLYLPLILVGGLVLCVASAWHCMHCEIKGSVIARLVSLSFPKQSCKGKLGLMERCKAVLEVCCWRMSRQVQRWVKVCPGPWSHCASHSLLLKTSRISSALLHSCFTTRDVLWV